MASTSGDMDGYNLVPFFKGHDVLPLTLSAILILYGGAMTFGEDSGAVSGFADRLGQIGMAAISSVTALAILEASRPAKGSVLQPAPPQQSA